MNKWILGGIAMTLMLAPDGLSKSASAQTKRAAGFDRRAHARRNLLLRLTL